MKIEFWMRLNGFAHCKFVQLAKQFFAMRSTEMLNSRLAVRNFARKCKPFWQFVLGETE